MIWQQWYIIVWMILQALGGAYIAVKSQKFGFVVGRVISLLILAFVLISAGFFH